MSTTPGDEQPRDEPSPPVSPPSPPRDEPPAGGSLPPASPPPPRDEPPPAYPPPPGYSPPFGSPPPPGPPQPGYPPEPGYPPPPGPPPPGYPPGQGYAPPPPAQPALWSVALSDGWRAFGRVAGVFIGALVVWVIIAVAVMSVVSAIFGGWGDVAGGRGGRSPFAIGFHVSWLVLTVAGAFVAAFVVATFTRNALEVTYGRRPTFGDFFRFADLGPVAILALLVAAIHVVAGLVGWIPLVGQLVSLAIEFFLMFAYFFLLHRRLAPVDSVRASADLVTRHLSTTVVFFLLEILIVLAGFVACGVGIFVAAPVVLLATAYLYRRLLGEQPQLPA